MSKEIVLACQSLSKTYQDGKQKINVIHDINLQVVKGQKVAILGQSGSGKTTLLNLLGGLDKPTTGKVYLSDCRFDHLSANKRALMRNKHLGFIYQLHHLLPEFSALDNVLLPLMMREGVNKAQAVKRAREMLDIVGLCHRMDHKPATLSGGERQRVAIARALVTQPSCVLADEPTGNLDAHNSENILKLINTLSDQFAISFVVVTHDYAFAKQMDHIYEIEDGHLIDRPGLY
ncbi:ABC transporter ATP-binding protein [Facilibium subflavum]|uniref:ABC transporter ATP-binding protein n=1 Tax=Facilibium subflavum TaxID=2219058 RepID=UPI000E659DA1|nr:ATP-binding cassette domain-containing protein [Facilibium subflavum]